MTADEWQAHTTHEAAKAIGEWLEGRGRLHQPIRCLTTPELEAIAQNAIMDLEHCLFTAVNKDTLELHHEVVGFDPRAAQALSDKAVDILRAVESGELPPRIAASPDFYLCRWCAYAQRCWEGMA